MTPHRRSAVVVGGTGAVGHHIVEQLLASSAWQSVTTVGRRACPLPAGTAGADKLTQCVVADMGALQDAPAARDAFGSADAVFCALGTTRGDAGSAEAFRRVDYEYVAAAAAAAKAGGRAAWFGLVSAQGANANVPAWDWPRLLHPLLYTQTKGRAENACTGQGFGRTAIFRPGMIDRGDRARGVERAFSFLGSIPAADIARAMVADAEAYLASPPSSALAQQQQQQQQQGGVAAAVAVVEGNAAIKRLAAEAARAAAATTAQ